MPVHFSRSWTSVAASSFCWLAAMCGRPRDVGRVSALVKEAEGSAACDLALEMIEMDSRRRAAWWNLGSVMEVGQVRNVCVGGRVCFWLPVRM
jgi:hypothetical protein